MLRMVDSEAANMTVGAEYLEAEVAAQGVDSVVPPRSSTRSCRPGSQRGF
jgi:hypothetical protein